MVSYMKVRLRDRLLTVHRIVSARLPDDSLKTYTALPVTCDVLDLVRRMSAIIRKCDSVHHPVL
jgi:hypothetical protein